MLHFMHVCMVHIGDCSYLPCVAQQINLIVNPSTSLGDLAVGECPVTKFRAMFHQTNTLYTPETLCVAFDNYTHLQKK